MECSFQGGPHLRRQQLRQIMTLAPITLDAQALAVTLAAFGVWMVVGLMAWLLAGKEIR